MKKIFTLTLFFLLSNLYVFAQSHDGGHPSYSTGGSGVNNLNTGSSSSGSSYNSSGTNSNSSGSNNTDLNNYTPVNNSNDNYNNYNRGSNYTIRDKYAHSNYDRNNRKYNPDQRNTTRYRSTFYLKVGLGYAFATAGQTLNENSEPYSSTMNFDNSGIISSYTSLKKISFSTGLQATGAFGWIINKNMGIEVDGYFGIAPRKYTATFNNILVNGSYPANITVTNKAISPIFVAPCFVLQSAMKKWNVYGRFGVVIPANGKVMREELYNFSAPGFQSSINQIVIDTKITTSMNLGFTGAMGVKYKLNRRISLWTEIDMLSISLDIKQEINTKNMADGQSGALYPTVNYGFGGSNVNRNNQTGTQPSYAEPFSNVGISAGIALDF